MFQACFHSGSRTLLEKYPRAQREECEQARVEGARVWQKVCTQWAPGTLNTLASSLAALGSQNGWQRSLPCSPQAVWPGQVLVTKESGVPTEEPAG